MFDGQSQYNSIDFEGNVARKRGKNTQNMWGFIENRLCQPWTNNIAPSSSQVHIAFNTWACFLILKSNKKTCSLQPRVRPHSNNTSKQYDILITRG
jgi:hypothetical protein